MRAAYVPRQRVERGKNGDIARGKNRSEEAYRFGDGFGLLVGRDDKKCRAAEFSGEIGGKQGFCSGLQAGKMNERFAGTQRREGAIHRGEAQQAFQSFTNNRKNHAFGFRNPCAPPILRLAFLPESQLWSIPAQREQKLRGHRRLRLLLCR